MFHHICFITKETFQQQSDDCQSIKTTTILKKQTNASLKQLQKHKKINNKSDQKFI